MPIVNGPFLTELDSRAAIKGSRDPLGIQPLWTRLGRYVVGNLTTVTNSVRDFTTLILGYYFAERLSDDLGPGSELAVFLKWEQLAAYARYSVNGERGFRGIERVQKAANDNSRVVISADQAHQILSNQKTYGLWGLYTMPARSSGLVEGVIPRLTPPTLEFVEKYYLPLLQDGAGKHGRRIQELLKQPLRRIDLQDSLIGAVAKLLQSRILVREREFYRFHLLYGGPQDETGGRQQQLVALLEGTLSDEEFYWSPGIVDALAKDARLRGTAWEPLGQRLSRIRTCESVLAPISLLFTYLLGLDGQPIKSAVKQLQKQWGEDGLRTVNDRAFEELRTDLGDADTAGRWLGIAQAVATGRYAELIDLMLQQNTAVMGTRGGAAAWIGKRDGRLQVRFRDEQGELPMSDEIVDLWRFSYFLDSLRNVTSALRED